MNKYLCGKHAEEIFLKWYEKRYFAKRTRSEFITRLPFKGKATCQKKGCKRKGRFEIRTSLDL